MLNCEVKNPQISPRCINRRIPWRKLHVVAHLSSKLFCHPSHHISPYLIISCLSWLSGFMHCLVPRGNHAGSRGVPVVGASPQQIQPWLCKQLGGACHGQHSCFKLRSCSDDLGTWEWMGMDSSPVSFGLLGNLNDGYDEYDGGITIGKRFKTPNILVSCFDHGTCG